MGWDRLARPGRGSVDKRKGKERGEPKERHVGWWAESKSWEQRIDDTVASGRSASNRVAGFRKTGMQPVSGQVEAVMGSNSLTYKRECRQVATRWAWLFQTRLRSCMLTQERGHSTPPVVASCRISTGLQDSDVTSSVSGEFCEDVRF
jgi:hypothetical protein